MRILLRERRSSINHEEARIGRRPLQSQNASIGISNSNPSPNRLILTLTKGLQFLSSLCVSERERERERELADCVVEMDYELNTKKQTHSSSSATSSASSVGEYEVFLSFRGDDTRKGFTDFLYNDLVDAGIRTFRDDDELRVGEEIGPELLKAISDSKISIPIFSKNYASSKWCLRELAQMVDCQISMGQLIFPIFYDVEPYDVRHQTGSYEEAFRQHHNCFDEKTVQKWKQALREVGQLKGWELEKQTNGKVDWEMRKRDFH